MKPKRTVPKQLHKMKPITHVDDLVQSSAQAKRNVAPRLKALKVKDKP